MIMILSALPLSHGQDSRLSSERPRGDTESAASSVHYSAAIIKLTAAVEYEVEQKQIPAFSLSMVDSDRIIWADGFGFQDADRTVPATADTVYRVGSVSKLFTDITVMQLVESERLDLDSPVQDYLPDFRPRNPHGTPVTLRQLMAHQSGLVRESPVGNYFDPTEPTLGETIASLNDTALVYPPESKTKYSNAALAVVGGILEASTGQTHPELVRAEILDPLGMPDSSFVLTPETKSKLATGWMWTYDDRRFEAPEFLLGTGPAGNMYSSVRDLAQFLICILAEGRSRDGQVLKPESYAQMITPILDGEGQPQSFGLGFHIQNLDGFIKVGHGGAVYGFSTQLEALPERKLGVVAASSLDGSNGVVGRLADYALRLMIATQDGEPLPEYRRTQDIAPERAEQLIGRYREVDGERTAQISEFNGKVYIRRGTFRHELRAATDDGTILIDDVIGFGTEVHRTDGEGLLVGEVRLQRLADEPPPDVPDRWRGLIGEYGWDHNTLYILEDEGSLYALIEWFYYYPLREIAENEFAFPDYGLYHGEGLQFTRDATGNITEVTAAEVRFVRREVGTVDGETFKIVPVKPRAMEAEGFRIYEVEWWHFDYREWQRYRIGNATFEELDARNSPP